VRAAACLLLLSCIPPLRSAQGYACDSQHPCPDDLDCVGGICGGALDGGGTGGGGMHGMSCGPSNEVGNGGFESSVIGTWVVSNGLIDQTTTVVHSGTRAGKVTPLSSGNVSLSPLTQVGTSGTGTFCAEAWVLGVDAGAVSLSLMGASTTSQHVTSDGTWQHLSDSFDVGDFTFSLMLSVDAPVDSTGALFVDDVCFSKCQ
jgi:hypothetical protein